MTFTNLLMEIGPLALLGSWSLAAPAAVLTAAIVWLLGRKRPLKKRAATLWALASSALVATGVIVAMWGLRGDFEDPISLIVLIPGATIIAMLGAVPAALFVRWMQSRNGRDREVAADLDIA